MSNITKFLRWLAKHKPEHLPSLIINHDLSCLNDAWLISLATILNNEPELVDFDTPIQITTQEGCQAFITLLRNNPAIRHVAINAGYFAREENLLQTLIDAIKVHPGLVRFQFDGGSSKFVIRLLAQEPFSRNLTHIIFSEYLYDCFDEILTLIRENDALTALEFNRTRLEGVQESEILETLKKNYSLTSLTFRRDDENKPLFQKIDRLLARNRLLDKVKELDFPTYSGFQRAVVELLALVANRPLREKQKIYEDCCFYEACYLQSNNSELDALSSFKKIKPGSYWYGAACAEISSIYLEEVTKISRSLTKARNDKTPPPQQLVLLFFEYWVQGLFSAQQSVAVGFSKAPDVAMWLNIFAKTLSANSEHADFYDTPITGVRQFVQWIINAPTLTRTAFIYQVKDVFFRVYQGETTEMAWKAFNNDSVDGPMLTIFENLQNQIRNCLIEMGRLTSRSANDEISNYHRSIYTEVQGYLLELELAMNENLLLVAEVQAFCRLVASSLQRHRPWIFRDSLPWCELAGELSQQLLSDCTGKEYKYSPSSSSFYKSNRIAKFEQIRHQLLDQIHTLKMALNDEEEPENFLALTMVK